MPMIPSRWQRWTCADSDCAAIFDCLQNGRAVLYCPMCKGDVKDVEVVRMAVDLQDFVIGSGPQGEALLDYAGAIANALVDIRNMIDVKL